MQLLVCSDVRLKKVLLPLLFVRVWKLVSPAGGTDIVGVGKQGADRNVFGV